MAKVAGTESIATNMTLKLRRKSKRTRDASTTPIRMASRVLSADARMRSLWSYQLAILTPDGTSFCISASFSFTAAAMRTVLPPGC